MHANARQLLAVVALVVTPLLIARHTPALAEFSSCTRPDVAVQVADTPKLQVNADRAVWPAVATIQLGGCPVELIALTDGPQALVSASCSEGPVTLEQEPAVVCPRLVSEGALQVSLQIDTPTSTPPSITWVVEQLLNS